MRPRRVRAASATPVSDGFRGSRSTAPTVPPTPLISAPELPTDFVDPTQHISPSPQTNIPSLKEIIRVFAKEQLISLHSEIKKNPSEFAQVLSKYYKVHCEDPPSFRDLKKLVGKRSY